ncbi:MAG: hypothetical protein QM762_22645 [Chryseolinea sp.]
MNQQPDKLFRDKLQNYQKTVPASAWGRISASQDKKKRPGVWIKFAASLLLVACAGAIWVLVNNDASGDRYLSDGNKKVTSDTTPSPDSAIRNTSPEHSTNVSESLAQTTEKQPVNHVKRNNTTKGTSDAISNRKSAGSNSMRTYNQVAQTTRTDTRNENATRTESSDVPIVDVEKITSATASNNPVTNDAVASAGVTLTYTVEDVSAYLEKNSSDEATDEEKKQSTLKKLLQKANDLKTNQDPVGELRQRKNEILALNFMNDKRGQKTRN